MVKKKKKKKMVTWLKGFNYLEEVQLVEKMMVSVGLKKNEKPSARRKKEKLIEKREKLAMAILSLTRSWVGGEGWVVLCRDIADVEVAEEAADREKRERIVA